MSADTTTRDDPSALVEPDPLAAGRDRASDPVGAAGPAHASGPTSGAPTRSRASTDRRRRRRPAPTAWVDAAVLGTATALAGLPMVPVFGPGAGLPATVGGAAIGAVLAATAARHAWGGLVGLAVVLVTYVVVGPALAAPGAALSGVVPTPASTAALLRAVVTVWKEVLTLDPELGASGALLAAPLVLGLGGAAVAVSIAARAPRRAGAWAGLVPPAVLGVAVLLGTKTTVLPVLAGGALALLLLPWAAWHRGTLAARRVVALAVVAAAVAGGAAAGPSLVADRERLVLRDEMAPPFDPREHPSPLSSFRTFVKQWRETDLLVVRGLPEGARVRLATLDSFDGVVWNVAGSEQAEGSGSFRRVGETIATPVTGEQVRVEFEVRHLPMVWLPTVGYAERFDFAGPGAAELTTRLRYNDATGAAVLTEGVPDGATWTQEAVLPPRPDDADLIDAAIADVRLPRPAGVPDAVPAYANEVAQTAASPAQIAAGLADSLAERGYFSHGVLPAEEPSLSGHGADRITTLLTGELMVGDGEQYASAMALMARDLGLPARVVLGFVPDEEAEAGADGDTDDGAITITGADVQAWVEVRFAGHGWVAYDPTPDESRTPRSDEEARQAAEDPQVRQPPPPLSEPVEPPEDDTEQPRTQDQDEEPVAEERWGRVLLVAGAATLPLLLVAGPVVLVLAAKARRRRRRRAASDPVRRVVGGWDEVLDEARDLRHAVPATATRRETAVHLAEAFPRPTRHGAVGAAVAGLAASADAVVFGPGRPPDEHVRAYWRQVEVARAAMRAAVPRRRRLRARLTTASLRHRRRAAKAAARASRHGSARPDG